jgi:photosystem II stability/assembly factor-like uncharacterized protein
MKKLVTLLCAACLAAPLAAAQETKRYDVLDLPAVQSPLAQNSLVYSLTRAGDRIVATGIRGHILYSDDLGKSWTQAESVPVRSSLLDAVFPTPELGWAVGHDGVILHTGDGGKTWVKQADGRELPKIGLAYYQEKQAVQPDNERYALLVDEMNLAAESGPDRPLFKVFMRDATTGFVVGAYGTAFRTTDGGSHWYPIMELTDLEQFVHLFDYAQLPEGPAMADAAGNPGIGDMVLAGEMGTILAFDAASQQWRKQEFPYEGSMFTLLATGGDSLLAGGLRGLVFRSEDRGRSWQEVTKPASGAIVASVLLADGRIVLATQEGNLLLSTDHGASFAALPLEKPAPISDLLEGRPGELILSGSFGLRVQALPAMTAVAAQP